MKNGNAGLTGCCGSNGLWMVHCNCPNPVPSEHGYPDTDPDGYGEQPSDNEITSKIFAYEGRSWNNEYGLTTHKEIRPEIWPNGPGGVLAWHVHAVKGPTSYPGEKCEKHPPISSAVEGGTGEWQADLGVIMEVELYTPEGGDTERLGIPRGFGWVYRSRAICTDGAQSHVAYCLTGRVAGEFHGITDPFRLDNPPRPHRWVFGDTVIVDIGNPGTDDSPPPRYWTDTLNGLIWNSDGNIHASAMELAYMTIAMPTLYPDDAFDNTQYPCYSTSYGKRYSVFSTYQPYNVRTNTGFTLGGGAGWQMVRIKNVGTRQNDDDETVDGIEVFSTFSGGMSSPPPDLGKDTSDYPYAGDFIVMLPSVRCSLDSSVDSDDSPDEPYVCAVHKDFSSTHLICAPWKSKIFRPGYQSESDFSGVADGTLSSSEVAVAETIIDAASPPDDYPDETFSNLSVWCYNRVWDPVENKSVNLLVFTTFVEDTPTTADDVIADFEQPDGFVPSYLDNGLPDGLHYTSSGDLGNGWQADNTGLIGDDHAFGGDGGSYSAKTNINVTFISDTNLSITVNVAEEGDFTFKYRFDNRIADGVRDGSLPFTSLTNLPNVDNTFGVYLDGEIATTDNFKIDGSPASGLIDNHDFTTESEYLTWYTGTLHLLPGTHTIRRTVHRGDAQDVLIAQVDHETYPKIMVGDDIDGLTRWCYDGYKVRKLTDAWAWAERDEEDAEPIASRAQTVPHFITMDGAGRVLIGSPHYTARYLRDGTLDKTHGGGRGPGFEGQGGGWRRWTASPSIERPTPSCLDPDDTYTADTVADPPPGACQILAVGEDTYQVRGVNGDLDRDTTIFPFDKELWTYRHPLSGKINNELFVNAALVTPETGHAGYWSERVHSWTVTNDGKDAEPHIEVLWRPTMHQPAYPAEPGTTDAERFPHPPFRTDFADKSDVTTDWAPASVRWREPFMVQDRVLAEGDILSVSGSSVVVSGTDAADDDAYEGGIFVAGLQEGDVGGFDHVTDTVTVGPFDPPLEAGFGYQIIKTRPRWSPANLIIPRTYSDAWSPIPQGVWVRQTDDPPADDSDPNWWDPDLSPSEIAALQDGDTVHPRGGPWGSARWVLVMTRFNPTGFRFFSYEFNVDSEEVCSGHGPDEDDADEVGMPKPKRFSSIQRVENGKAGFSAKNGSTDFDAIQCDCGCC